jgi:DNA replication and repair protein RecF
MATAKRLTVERLGLRCFRNYAGADLVCGSGLNLIVGTNGQGKSNLLEALHLLAFLRSFRTRRVSELVTWGESGLELAATLCPDPAAPRGAHLRLRHGAERELLVDGVPVARASEFINRFCCVPFLPEDLGLIKGPAAERRRFLDMLAGQLDRDYLRHLTVFVQALKNRNAMLRQPGRFQRNARAPYEQLLIRHGAAVAVARTLLVDALAQPYADASSALLGSPARLQYKPGFSWQPGADPQEAATRFAAALASCRQRDEREGQTTCGPQRDDLEVCLEGRPLAVFGSEGQCRAGALSLRLGSLALLRGQEIGRHGQVLLIDDVLGELDTCRRRAFWEQVRDAGQLFMTCTDVPPEVIGTPHDVVTVQAGTLQRCAAPVAGGSTPAAPAVCS